MLGRLINDWSNGRKKLSVTEKGPRVVHVRTMSLYYVL